MLDLLRVWVRRWSRRERMGPELARSHRGRRRGRDTFGDLMANRL